MQITWDLICKTFMRTFTGKAFAFVSAREDTGRGMYASVKTRRRRPRRRIQVISQRHVEPTFSRRQANKSRAPGGRVIRTTLVGQIRQTPMPFVLTSLVSNLCHGRLWRRHGRQWVLIIEYNLAGRANSGCESSIVV